MSDPFLTELELGVVALIYAAGGAAFIWAFLLRRAAVREWRKAIGGAFDKRQHRFATELEIDRARLPPAAQTKLMESRRALLAGAVVLGIALLINIYVMQRV